MGTWGPGNFDSDTAADHLGEVTGNLIQEIENAFNEGPSALEPDEYWGVAVLCNLELLRVIHEKKYLGSNLPTLDQLIKWKSIYLETWEQHIDELYPKPEYKIGRKQVLTSTFDSLISIVEKSET